MLATVLLFSLMLAATVTDLARHKIYNWITYTGIAAALGLNAVGSLLLAAGWMGENQLQPLGWIPFIESLFGLFVCGFVMVFCFVMFSVGGVGGGDVKLIAMIGAFFGPEQGVTAMLWTCVLGACMGLIVLIWRVGPLRTVGLVFRRIASAVARVCGLPFGVLRPLSDDERVELQLPLFLAPSALAAVVLVRFSLMDWLM
jgi:prepilin peptidase CpaA